ncbi:unnamed protein product [Heterobilharzia americana]|nr:unnamed protein product [Heterobilharzia americana]
MFCFVAFRRLHSWTPISYSCSSRYISSETADEKGGFTRSIYSLPQYKHVVRNGKALKVYTGLVDETLTFKDGLRENFYKSWTKKVLTMQSLSKRITTRAKERIKHKQIY